MISLVKGDYSNPTKERFLIFKLLQQLFLVQLVLVILLVWLLQSVAGPGATFWMIVAGLIGMSSKFVECTLGVKYRKIDKNGVVSGGPMYYLRDGLAKKNLPNLGKALAVLFAILCVGGSIGGVICFKQIKLLLLSNHLISC